VPSAGEDGGRSHIATLTRILHLMLVVADWGVDHAPQTLNGANLSFRGIRSHPQRDHRCAQETVALPPSVDASLEMLRRRAGDAHPRTQ
jgi:hypothetical protein